MLNKLNSQKFSKYFLIAMCIVFLLLFLSIIRMFIIQIILAIVLAIIIHPIFKTFLKIFKNKRGISAFFTCIAVFFIIVIPIALITNILINQLFAIYNSFNSNFDTINNFFHKIDSTKIDKLMDSYLGQFISIEKLNWGSIIGNIINTLSIKMVSILNKSYKITFHIIFDFAIIMFSLFYILRDSEILLRKIKGIIPINEEYKDKIIFKFYSMTNATIKGIISIAFLQGLLATIVLLCFGIQNWLFLGIIALVLSFIPFIGSGAILIPAGIIQIISGKTIEGIVIIILSIGFISIVDNILRPIIIGEQSGMHDLLIFFSIIGGLFTFGASGLILGPMIASIFLTIIQIYKIEFISNQVT